MHKNILRFTLHMTDTSLYLPLEKYLLLEKPSTRKKYFFCQLLSIKFGGGLAIFRGGWIFQNIHNMRGGDKLKSKNIEIH